MGTTKYIRIREFCQNHEIEESFVLTLREYEVIQIEQKNNEPFIHIKELPKLEKMLRLHQELEINPQGLQAISHLLEKVSGLQDEVFALRRKLKRFAE